MATLSTKARTPIRMERFATPRDMSLVAIIVMAAFTLVGTISQLPSNEEKAAVLIEAKKYSRAIDLLELVNERGNLSENEAFTLIHLYALTDRSVKATNFLEGHLVDNPNNIWMLVKLAEMYRAQRNLEGEASALMRLVAFAPEQDKYRRLLAIYQLLGWKAEAAQMVEAANSHGWEIPAKDTEL